MNSYRYLLFFKPYDVLSAITDPAGRPAIQDFVPVPGLSVAGRLDQDSEGLMLLTDDGLLAHRLTHPDYHVNKTYFAQVEGTPDEKALAALRRGVPVKGEALAAAEVELLPYEPVLPPRSAPIRENKTVPTAWLRLVLREGKKRQIRHMTAAVGHPTLRLVRVAIGPLTARGMEPGQWRDLTVEEQERLKRLLRIGAGPRTRPAHSSQTSQAHSHHDGATAHGRMDDRRNPGPPGRGHADKPRSR
jgi:23S rRNA pseudouridine2457 synthase